MWWLVPHQREFWTCRGSMKFLRYHFLSMLEGPSYWCSTQRSALPRASRNLGSWNIFIEKYTEMLSKYVLQIIMARIIKDFFSNLKHRCTLSKWTGIASSLWHPTLRPRSRRSHPLLSGWPSKSFPWLTHQGHWSLMPSVDEKFFYDIIIRHHVCI